MWFRKIPKLFYKQTVVERIYISTTAPKLKETDTNNTRNIGILAHIDAGI